jgi:hypothetical protein
MKNALKQAETPCLSLLAVDIPMRMSDNFSILSFLRTEPQGGFYDTGCHKEDSLAGP